MPRHWQVCFPSGGPGRGYASLHVHLLGSAAFLHLWPPSPSVTILPWSLLPLMTTGKGSPLVNTHEIRVGPPIQSWTVSSSPGLIHNHICRVSCPVERNVFTHTYRVIYIKWLHFEKGSKEMHPWAHMGLCENGKDGSIAQNSYCIGYFKGRIAVN